MSKKYVKTLVLMPFFFILWVIPLFSQIDVQHKNLNTNGDTKGMAVQGYYVYLADGPMGLKIVNMSNPHHFITTAALPLPGSFIHQAAVDGNMVVLTDTINNQVHFVDVTDKMRPQLKWTLAVQGDIPRAVYAFDGKAYVVEFGDNPGDPGYFSGIEVFSYSGITAESIQLTPINEVRDVVIFGNCLFAASENSLFVFSRTSSGFYDSPFYSLDFPAGEEINSLAIYGSYIFAFGKYRLYAVGIIELVIPLPYPSKTTIRILRIVITDQAAVPGVPENRKVDAAVLDYGDGTTSEPKICILLTTQECYGMYTYDWTTYELTPVNMYDMTTSSWIVFYNVYDATEGKVSIFDSAFPQYFHPGFLKGGVMGLGAIGSYGLGYVYIENGL